MAYRRIKLVHLQVLPLMSGVQKVMVDFLLKLDPNKYKIHVICQTEGDLTQALTENNISFITLPQLKRRISPYYDIFSFFKLLFLFKKYKFDIVHTHSSKPGFVGRIAAKLANVPCIVHTVHGFAFHQFSSDYNRILFRFLERIAGLVSDKIILLNHYDYSYAIKNRIAKCNKLTIIYNGISINKIDIVVDVTRKKKQLSIPNGFKVVGSVGRLWDQKAPQAIINAIPIVIKEYPNVIFLIIGDGPLLKKLKTMVDQLSINNNIKFLGWRKDVPELLKTLDVFIQPSLWEGLSLSIMEAMACQLPVIATDIKGNNEVVLDNITGYLIQPNCPEELAQRIVILLKNKALSLQMGLSGAKRIKTKFNIDLYVGKTEQVYHEILRRSAKN